jgi:DnaJ-class molecular chaperone
MSDHDKTTLTPHVCPICGGRGKVAKGFYDGVGLQISTTDTTPETCRACGGRGIIIT